MNILHRYVFVQVVRNLLLSLVAFTLLFLIFDFFDRIDNMLPEGASIWVIFEYFALKVPLMVSLMLPVAVLVSVMLTIGILSKNSEITAMRASGLTVWWITRPLLLLGLGCSIFSLVLNELAVPYCLRRVKEIYNIDIQQKDKKGGYSQSDFWWRSGKNFYSVGMFDSRSKTLHQLTWLEVAPTFEILRRTDADQAEWLKDLGWNMKGVTEYQFSKREVDEKGHEPAPAVAKFNRLPLPIADTPQDFYDTKTDPSTMSYRQLRRFIKEQMANGIPIKGYLADLYEKLAFPFLSFVVIPVVLPFALKPARSGSMALSFLAGMIIAFSYYAVHSFSLAFGRAEIWSPLLSAWMANAVMGLVGLILFLGAESPS